MGSADSPLLADPDQEDDKNRPKPGSRARASARMSSAAALLLGENAGIYAANCVTDEGIGALCQAGAALLDAELVVGVANPRSALAVVAAARPLHRGGDAGEVALVDPLAVGFAAGQGGRTAIVVLGSLRVTLGAAVLDPGVVGRRDAE